MPYSSPKVKDLMTKCFNAVTQAVQDHSTKVEKKSKGFIIRFDQPQNDRAVLQKLVKAIKATDVNLDKPEYRQIGAGYSVTFKGDFESLNCNIIYFALDNRAAINVDCF